MLGEYHEEEESLVRVHSKKDVWSMSRKQVIMTVAGVIGAILCVLLVVVIGIVIISLMMKWMNPSLCTVNCQPVSFANGAVAADNQQCSEVGAQVLREYGNAVDAAVATALCLGVCSPISSGIGGGGVMLVRSGNFTYYYNFREKAGMGASRDMYNQNPLLAQRGILAIGVPGEVKGLFTAWLAHGSKPWKGLVLPAVNIARNGVVITAHMGAGLKRFEAMIKNNTGMSEMFAPNGTIYQVGDIAKYPKLADTLEKIGEDPRRFYTGDIAAALSNDILSAGGILNMTDFENYHVVEEKPMEAMFNGFKLMGPQGLFTGGPCLLQGFNILNGYLLNQSGFSFSSSHYIVESMKHYFAWRMQLGDPSYVDLATFISSMTSDATAANLRAKILPDKTQPSENYMLPGFGWAPDSHGTTHFSVVDQWKNAVAMTSTVNLEFGSFVVSPSTGIILNDEMDDFSIPNRTNAFGIPPSENNFIAPGKRPLSSMSPFIVLKDDQVYLVAGASGGPRIISATYQVLLNSLVFGMNVGESVNSPRVHHQLYPRELMIEQGYPFSSQFQAAGHVLRPLTQGDGLLGVTQAIQVMKDGSVQASCDRRKGGQPDGY
jgi:gamma-glutamyltranspeptidase/glutathione hydrolase/leukotriene-C4 hydrolase